MEIGAGPSQFHMTQLAKKRKPLVNVAAKMKLNMLEKSRWGKKVHWGTPPFPTQSLCILEILNRPHTVLYLSTSLTFSTSFK